MKEIIYAKETFVPVKGYEDRIAITKNGRIFSLKTFQGLTKDDSVKLKITWTITF